MLSLLRSTLDTHSDLSFPVRVQIAVAAYNRCVHSAVGATPLSLWRPYAAGYMEFSDERYEKVLRGSQQHLQKVAAARVPGENVQACAMWSVGMQALVYNHAAMDNVDRKLLLDRWTGPFSCRGGEVTTDDNPYGWQPRTSHCFTGEC